MVLGVLKNGKRKRAAQRIIVLLLLSLTFVDLTVIDLFAPGLCEGRDATFSQAQTPTSVNPQGIAQIAITGAQHQGLPGPLPLESDEDCFCCCAHILPSIYFRLSILQLPYERSFIVISFLPSAPPTETFRPPRIA